MLGVHRIGLRPIPLSPSRMARSQSAANVGIGSRGSEMKLRPAILLLLLVSCLSPGGTANSSPDSVVRALYQQIVARRPFGIPKGEDKAAIWPYLSKGLIHKLETAQACEDSYFQQHTS